jgi:putative inorganic carbon (hco3(-)) transporter
MERSMAIGALANGPSTSDVEILPFLLREAPESRSSAIVDQAGYVLFLAATAVLLLRPADSIPDLQNVPIYQFFISACLCLSIPRILRQFTTSSPTRALTLLIFGIWIFIILSHLARGSLWDARISGVEFLKLFIYYLLTVSWADSPGRLRQFMLCLIVCIFVQTILGLFEYDGWINLSTLRSIEEAERSDGSITTLIVHRLCGIGIFDDPNDLCQLLVMAMMLCFGLLGCRHQSRLSFGWLLPLGVFVYSIALTRSRSGFLSLLAAIGTLLMARYGRGRALFYATLLLPVIFLIFAGRQTDVDLSDRGDTFQTRLDCWSDSLDLFKSSPVFGVGEGQQVEQRYYVAHNSFIQSFAELGFAGGACFLGAFLVAIRAIHQTDLGDADPGLARLQPVFLAVIIAYAIGLLALSRGYTISTYLILGLAAAYINLTPRARPFRLNFGFIQQLMVASILFVAATYLFIRVMKA